MQAYRSIGRYGKGISMKNILANVFAYFYFYFYFTHTKVKAF